MKKTDKLAKAYRVESGKNFRLKDFDPADTGHWHSKEHAEKALQEGMEQTAELQDKLYAQDNWSLLLIFQAMDAAGKDGIIKHVMSGVNPAGLPGLFVQSSLRHRTAARFSLADDALSAGARAHRDFQPVVLRRGAGGASAS